MQINYLAAVGVFVMAMLMATPVLHAAPTPDAVTRAQLDSLGYPYEVDADGDFSVVIEVDGDRTQQLFIRSKTSTYRSTTVREIWVPAYALDGKKLSATIANRLLESSGELILGAWSTMNKHVMLITKVSADASAKSLEDAMVASARAGDKMERELASDPDADEF